MGTRNIRKGRHRLGAGRVHCLRIPGVADRIERRHRSLFALRAMPARHRLPARRPALAWAHGAPVPTA